MINNLKCDCDRSRGFDPSLHNMNLDCPATWDLICDGNTIGCFQIDSRLGRQISKKAAPRSIKELADVISLGRPGPLESKMDDGKNMVEHYYMRKHGEEDPFLINEIVSEILSDTYGLIIFQEQILRLMQEIAGFTEVEADLGRRAIGKKKVELMAKIRKDFIEGSIGAGKVTKSEAEQLFDWIEKSQRYGFNASHACGYALCAYQTAYAKTHFPKEFYCALFNHARDKSKPLEEIERFAQDARKNNIKLDVPDICCKNVDFEIQNGIIKFGLGHIKSMGAASIRDAINTLPDNICDMNMAEAMFYYLLQIKGSSAKVLIASGAMDFLKISRQKLLYYHDQLSNLNKKEVQYIVEKCNCAKDSIEKILGILLEEPTGRGKVFYNSRRKNAVSGILQSLQFPMFSLDDTTDQLAVWEQSYLGISITCSRFDSINERGSIKCEDFEKTERRNHGIVGQVRRINEIKTKDGDDMAFAVVSDDSGTVEDVTFFPGAWDEIRGMISSNEILKFVGYKDFDREAFIVNSVHEIS